jgi:DNA-binding NarL/FixJ family response regulator
MSFDMQPVPVAIADADRTRRAEFERFLQSDNGIKLLTNVAAGNGAGRDHTFTDRRLKSRTDVSAEEDEVARIKRLNPLVLLVNLNMCGDEDYALLLSLRRECPDALMVLLTDDSIREDQLMKIMEIGARGYLKNETVQLHLSRAIKAVGRGEAWVPRKMLGGIMDHMLNS